MDRELTAPRAALVTGASRGIGRSTAELLAANGRRVVACARDAALLDELARAYPESVLPLPADLAEEAALVPLLDAAERLVGPLDELVYVAGMVRYAAIGAVTPLDLRAQLELNFVAPFLLLQEAGIRMRARGRGAQVVIASTLATHGARGTSAYAASKAALVSAARSLARELAPEVRVNAVAPGVVDTDMVRVPRRTLGPGESPERAVEEQLATLRALHPLGTLGAPEDVARAVLYLLEAPWVTGTVLTVDGGLTL